MNAIEVKNLSFQYPNQEVLWKDLSFIVQEHEHIFIEGASGVGKSSLFYAINHCVPMHIQAKISGEVYLFDTLIKEYEHAKRIKSINLVFQQAHWQFVGLTVMDELAFALENLNVDSQTMAHKINEILNKFDIQHLKDKKTSQCSIGEQQLIALAATMLIQPRILCLDEALSAVSLSKKRQIIPIIQQEVDTLLVVDHQKDPLWRMDRSIRL